MYVTCIYIYIYIYIIYIYIYIYILNIYREYLLCPQSNSSDSFLQTCINLSNNDSNFLTLKVG